MKLVAIILTLSLTLPLAWLVSEPPGVLPGVSIDGTRVDGLTFRDLRAYCKKRAQDFGSSKSLRLVMGSSAWTVPYQRLGVSCAADAASAKAYMMGREPGLIDRLRSRMDLVRGVNVHTDVAVDKAKLQQVFRHAATSPRDATAEVKNGNVEVLPAAPGLCVDVAKAVPAIRAAVADGRTAVQLPTVRVEADIDATGLAGVTAVRSQALVHVTSPVRAAWSNAVLACRAIDGTVVKPGEVCSVNRSIGVRSAKEGYLSAPVFINGKADTAIGGGICCLASAVFRCIALGGLDLIQSHQHARVVKYAAPGLDSTLVWGQKDLQFRNNTAHALVIRAKADPRRRLVKVELLGEPNKSNTYLVVERHLENNRLIARTYRCTDGVRQLLRVSDYPAPKQATIITMEAIR